MLDDDQIVPLTSDGETKIIVHFDIVGVSKLIIMMQQLKQHELSCTAAPSHQKHPGEHVELASGLGRTVA